MPGLRAGAALPLSGRDGRIAAQSEHGLRAWAEAAGADLRVEDVGDDHVAAGRLARELADTVDILFGPYGSGATRAVAAALADHPAVVWNHGGSAVPRTGARLVDVLAPAEMYWTGVADVLLADAVPLDRVAVLHADSGFGRSVASGAVAALAGAGASPLLVATFDAASVADRAGRVVTAGARAVIGCGRFGDDVALGAALAGSGVVLALVACGVRDAAAALGPAVIGTLGACQWLDDGVSTPAALGPDADYPAAQAYAAGLLAERAVAAAGSSDPDRVWDAAIRMRTATFLGPFAIDADGRQVAHRPVIVRWEDGAAGPVRRVAWRPPPTA